MKNDHDIDLDELDELPDVVLGEKTRALRLEREGGRTRLIDPVEEEPKEEPKEPSEEFQFTRSLDARRIAEELKKQEEAERKQEEQEKTEVIEKPLSRTARRRGKKAKTEETEVIPVAKERSVTEVLPVMPADPTETAEETEVIPVVRKRQPEAEVKPAVDEIAEEVPASIIDDDPGVDDELAKLFFPDDPKEEDDNATVAIDPAQTMKETSKTRRTQPEDDSSFEDTQTQTQSQLVYEDEPVKKKPKKRRRSPLRTVLLIVWVVLLVLLGLGGYGLYQSFQPVSQTGEGQSVYLTVNEGESLSSVCERLEEAGVIRNDQTAYLYARLKKYNDFTAGNHVFTTDMNLDEVFSALSQTTYNENTSSVTIIEGDWAKDIAARFAAVTDVSADELLALWNDEEWIRSQMDAYPFLTEEMFNDDVRIYLEGYLAPNTYQVFNETTAEDITKTMLDQSLAVYEKHADAIAASGHSIHEIYTMASIIQYEASTDEEDLAKVASVFYNRLEAGMSLGSSVTVCYAIDFDKQTDGWQACEMNSDFDSPYNTYMYDGLPPGAIENAGEAAIAAAVNPADTDYYYFMADVCGDGTVYFAETLDEHNANVSTYLADISNGCN